jgi:hypothetical protein
LHFDKTTFIILGYSNKQQADFVLSTSSFAISIAGSGIIRFGIVGFSGGIGSSFRDGNRGATGTISLSSGFSTHFTIRDGSPTV